MTECKDNAAGNWIKSMLISVDPKVLKLPARAEYVPWLRVANSPELTMVRLTGLLGYLDIDVPEVPTFVIDALPAMEDAELEKIHDTIVAKKTYLNDIEKAAIKLGFKPPVEFPEVQASASDHEATINYEFITLTLKGLSDPIRVRNLKVNVKRKAIGGKIVSCNITGQGELDGNAELVVLSRGEGNDHTPVKSGRSHRVKHLRVLDRGMAVQNLREEVEEK